jgi:hypothetical protein
MTTVLEECTTENQRSVVRFLWAKGLAAKDIYKAVFPVMVGSVCGVKRFTAGDKLSFMTRNLKRWCGSG